LPGISGLGRYIYQIALLLRRLLGLLLPFSHLLFTELGCIIRCSLLQIPLFPRLGCLRARCISSSSSLRRLRIVCCGQLLIPGLSCLRNLDPVHLILLAFDCLGAFLGRTVGLHILSAGKGGANPINLSSYSIRHQVLLPVSFATRAHLIYTYELLDTLLLYRIISQIS